MLTITAFFLMTVQAAQQIKAKAPSLGQASIDLLNPLSGLEKILSAICTLAGLAFLAGAFFQYMNHRKHPTQVTISKPIIFLILGLVFVTLPLWTEMSSGAQALHQ